MQGKGNVKMFLKMRDPQGGGYQGNHPRREFSNQTSPSGTQLVNSLFKEPIYHILEKIKNGPYFKWPNPLPPRPRAYYRELQNPARSLGPVDEGRETRLVSTLAYRAVWPQGS